MNELEAITTHLSKHEIAILMDIVEKAIDQKHQSTTITIGDYSAYRFEYRALEKLHFITLDDYDYQGRGVYLRTLLPPAIHRYNHEKRFWVLKQLNLIRLKYKDFMAIAAFIISLVLLFLRILEMGGYRLVFE